MSRIVIVICLALAYSGGFAQVLFSEDFEAEANGATSGTATGTVGGTWSSNNPGGTFSRQDLFRNSFLVDGTGSEGVWTTSSIDISASGYAILDIVIGSIGFGFDNGDYVRAYYILDNSGVEVLFAESYGSLLSDAVNGSAIISGSTVQIVVRAFDGSIFGVIDFDDVNVTAVPVLYSRKSGTWTDMTGGLGGSGTWSANRSGTPACGCVPLNDMVAIIQNGHTVTLPTSQTAVGPSGTPDLAPGGVDVESGGILQYDVSGVTLGIEAGYLRVRGGGAVNSSGAGITGETVSFNADIGGATVQVDAGGSLTAENLILTANASNFHYLEGGGTVAFQDDVIFNASGATLTNNLTAGLSITDRIQFSGSVTASRFNNNYPATAGTLYFDNDNNIVNNASTLTVSSVFVASSGDDNNTINNSGTLNLTSTTTSIDTNSGNFFINNYGTIFQDGDFADLVAASNFINRATGIWEWRKNGNTIAANFASVLDCTTAGNIFRYSGTSDQTIGATTYYHLDLLNGGIKTITATLDVNGNLTIENATTLAGTFALDVEGDIEMNGTGMLGGSGNVNIGGNWSGVDASSFTEGTRVVTFDGSGSQSITNAAGSEAFYSLTLNTSAIANTVTLQNDITVSQTLTLTRGRLNLNGNALYVTRNNNGAITGASANSFVISETNASPYSRIIWTTGATNASFTFPFGTSSGAYIPYGLVKTAGTAVAGTVSVATYTTAPDNTPYPASVTHLENASGIDQSANVVDRYWIVERSGYTSLTASQTVTYVAAEATGVTGPRRAQRWNGSNGWLAPVGSSSANPFTIPSSALSTSSIWVLVSNTTILPVEWLDFSATLNNHEVVIEWETASELNNDYFVVERAQDIERFEEVVRVDSKGDSHLPRKYLAIDPNPIYGTTYYRVRQVDFDGSVSHTGLKRVVYEGLGLPVLQAYPNPGQGRLITVDIRGLKDASSVRVEVYSATGSIVHAGSYPVETQGSLVLDLEFETPLPPGIYILKAGNTGLLTTKIVIE